MYICMYVGMYVCVKHVRMYAHMCMYVYMCVCVYLGAYVFFLNYADVQFPYIFIEPVSLT
jgi:hypothetical protein